MFRLDAADSETPLFVQIMDEVRRSIVLGTLRPCDPLPSVRQLALDLKVNPTTVQLAYRELERAGVVYARRGQGTFVAESLPGDMMRRELMRRVADRAVRDALRSGFGPLELIEAIRDAVQDAPSPYATTVAEIGR